MGSANSSPSDATAKNEVIKQDAPQPAKLMAIFFLKKSAKSPLLEVATPPSSPPPAEEVTQSVTAQDAGAVAPKSSFWATMSSKFRWNAKEVTGHKARCVAFGCWRFCRLRSKGPKMEKDPEGLSDPTTTTTTTTTTTPTTTTTITPGTNGCLRICGGALSGARSSFFLRLRSVFRRPAYPHTKKWAMQKAQHKEEEVEEHPDFPLTF